MAPGTAFPLSGANNGGATAMLKEHKSHLQKLNKINKDKERIQKRKSDGRTGSPCRAHPPRPPSSCPSVIPHLSDAEEGASQAAAQLEQEVMDAPTTSDQPLQQRPRTQRDDHEAWKRKQLKMLANWRNDHLIAQARAPRTNI